MIAALVLMAALAGVGQSHLDRCSRLRGGAAAIPRTARSRSAAGQAAS